MRPTPSSVLFAAVVAVALCAVLAVQTDAPGSAREPEHEAMAAIEATDTAARPKSKAASSPEVTSNPSPAKASLGRVHELDGLVAKGTPADSLMAWELLKACHQAQETLRFAAANSEQNAYEGRAKELADGTLKARAAEACGDLTLQHLARRLPLLERAAEAGVPKAAILLGREGPWGDPSAMYTRWDDPAVAAWRDRILELTKLAAAKGDSDALRTLGWAYRDGSGLTGAPNAAAALEYLTAYHAIAEKRLGRPVGSYKPLEIEALAKQLPADQAEEARMAGLRLAGVLQ